MRRYQLHLGLLAILPTVVACSSMVSASRAKGSVAIFAGGCFWCMQPPFDRLEGVLSTTVGFVGGQERNPSYEAVAHGRTGHTEAIKVVFDAGRISYDKLLDVFWRNIDPTDKEGQFVDRGSQYRPGIFHLDVGQREVAERSRNLLTRSKRFDRPIVVEITRATRFYPAERYHQRFYKKNPTRYYSYRAGSGRDRYLLSKWGPPR